MPRACRGPGYTASCPWPKRGPRLTLPKVLLQPTSPAVKSERIWLPRLRAMHSWVRGGKSLVFNNFQSRTGPGAVRTGAAKGAPGPSLAARCVLEEGRLVDSQPGQPGRELSTNRAMPALQQLWPTITECQRMEGVLSGSAKAGSILRSHAMVFLWPCWSRLRRLGNSQRAVDHRRTQGVSATVIGPACACGEERADGVFARSTVQCVH